MNAKTLAIAILPLLLLMSARVLATPPAAHRPASAAGSKSAPPGGSTIIGSQEMPRGAAIMPWHSARPEPFRPRALRVLNESLTPIDRRAFRREVRDYERLHAGSHSINRDDTNSDH